MPNDQVMRKLNRSILIRAVVLLIMDAVEREKRLAPTAEQLISELPVLVLPE